MRKADVYGKLRNSGSDAGWAGKEKREKDVEHYG